MTSDCLFHKSLVASCKFFNPKNLTDSRIVIKTILSDFKGLNSENLTVLTLTLSHSKVIKSQGTKKQLPSL